MQEAVVRRAATLLGVAVLLSVITLPAADVLGVQTPRPGHPPDELTGYVVKFTGPDHADCGRHFLARPFEAIAATERQRIVTCATVAAQDRRPFWAVVQLQGFDSL